MQWSWTRVFSDDGCQFHGTVEQYHDTVGASIHLLLQGAQSMFIADMHLFLLRSSAILEADTGLDRVAIQARAKVLEEKIHTQAISKVLCSALSSLSAS